MAPTGVYAAAWLMPLLAFACMVSASETAAKQETMSWDGTESKAGIIGDSRDAIACPGVCPACPGCPACPSPPACEIRIPVGYQYYEGLGYYKMHHEKVNWFDAKGACEQEGGYLVVLNSEEEARLVDSIVDKYSISDYIFIGFYDVVLNQTFVTVLGDPLSSTGYEVWSPNEPNNPGFQNCGQYKPGRGLDDENCLRQSRFICELFY